MFILDNIQGNFLAARKVSGGGVYSLILIEFYGNLNEQMHTSKSVRISHQNHKIEKINLCIVEVMVQMYVQLGIKCPQLINVKNENLKFRFF